MAIEKDMEETENTVQDEIRAPLVLQDEKHKDNNFMVYLSTFVAVCGSFAFGSCVSAHFIRIQLTFFEPITLRNMFKL